MSQKFMVLFTSLIALAGTSAFAHDEAPTEDPNFTPKTLVGDTPMHWGGFGSPVIKLTTLGGDGAVLVGGRGATVLNHMLAFGAGGFGRAGGGRDMTLGYGGPTVNVIFFSDRLLHFDVGTMVAWGRASEEAWRSNLFIVEPEANLELNMTQNFRIVLGGSYRFVLETSSVKHEQGLSGLAGHLAFRFGTF